MPIWGLSTESMSPGRLPVVVRLSNRAWDGEMQLRDFSKRTPLENGLRTDAGGSRLLAERIPERHDSSGGLPGQLQYELKDPKEGAMSARAAEIAAHKNAAAEAARLVAEAAHEPPTATPVMVPLAVVRGAGSEEAAQGRGERAPMVVRSRWRVRIDIVYRGAAGA
ncbi:hypothetical protein EMIHUDRAFT_201616 [Emiliania huxleyi CCMP1516]|uniref:C2 NT-type domain-containing protein n=2 Tax=Emiliania huxleyi TaxID=2903 RepID=A0A0D3KIA8_EMIH1|nr:hypothetical protein EMIHUDRAFT_201616 [Emiliania huxleyi CCMP1516]EOD35493.1 hypothetical protein EMIHUDRAFT_201616 [Emiliania huxleyi CCMP1516]|eukprot:XP_005787922.1 hypothetical protein EMIHUDRAFT_201616 [Emiliania huxleyi CCMP1516]